MTVFQKINGSWVPAKRPYVRRNGVYVPAVAVWVKRSGTWVRAYEYDVTPSASPELSLQIIQNRYISVGARLPGTQNDPDLKRIRVLASRTESPTTQFGAGFFANEADGAPGEPWSDWYYNGSNPNRAGFNHGVNTTVFNHKNWPVNPTDATNLPGSQFYYFAAWSEDMNGNWSPGTFTKIWMPKEGVSADKIILKEANFQANESGSAGVNSAGYVPGALTVQQTPRSNGLWFYNRKFTQAIGEQGVPTIRSAKILVTRGNDGGQTAANVRLFWHDKNTSGALPLLDVNQKQPTVIGTIQKMESKWFDIPTSYYSHFNTDINGFGLAYGGLASDFLVATGVDTHLRSGEVNVVWEEAP